MSTNRGEPASHRRTQTNEASSARLVSLAILKSNWDQGKSYLDNFVPFVVEALRRAGGGQPVEAVKGQLKSDFGLNIPHHTVKTILDRAVRKQLAKRGGEGKFTASGVTSMEMPRARAELVRSQKALIERLVSFSLDAFERVLTEAEADAALTAYVEEYGAPIALSAIRGAQLDCETRTDVDYIVHAFVERLIETDPEGFAYLEKVVQGSMLVSVLYLPDPSAHQRKFRESTVYLDTPFLLRAMGYCGAQLQNPAMELINLLHAYGARVACFDHTVTETQGVLLSALGQGSRNGRSFQGRSEVEAHFSQTGVTPADVQLLVGRLQRDLEMAGIGVLDRPAHVESLTVDEKALEELLRGEVKYFRDAPMIHDLNSLTAVHRLRNGRAPSILEESGAILVTTNLPLVRASRKFFSGSSGGVQWPPAILDSELATLMWLKQPMKAPDLPRNQIIADCYAALRPSPAVWESYLVEIERLQETGTVTQADVDIMRYSPYAQRYLMDRTFGQPAAVTAEAVGDVLDAARAKLTDPLERKIGDLARRLDDATRERRQVEEERDQLEAAKRELEDRHSATAAELQDAKAAEERKISNIVASADRAAAKLGTRLFWGLVVGALVLAAAGGTVLVRWDGPTVIRLIIITAAFLAFCTTAVIHTQDLLAARRSFVDWYAVRARKRALGRIGVTEQPALPLPSQRDVSAATASLAEGGR